MTRDLLGARLLLVVAFCCSVLGSGCTSGAVGPGPTPPVHDHRDDQAVRSRDALELHTSVDGPGCSVAVARQGEVVWRGGQGLADLEKGTVITPETVFDIGSVSKQFTAAAIVQLSDAGELSLDDPLADHLPGLPPWSKQATLAHLLHHTSGIPGYERLLEDRGFTFDERTTQKQAVEALAEVRSLDFAPGTEWAYSNSNYVLLAEVVRALSGEALPQYLRTHVFAPLDLAMVVDPVTSLPGKAVSYRGSPSRYEVVDYRWEQVGDGAIQTTPTELVRWADNYRTGRVGGSAWRSAVIDGAVSVPPGPTGEERRYGAGIFEGEDGSLEHPGGWEGFVSDFWVSPDRLTSVAVACNKSFDPTDLVRSLIDIWYPS